MQQLVFFFFVTLVTGPRRSLSLKLSDTRAARVLVERLVGERALGFFFFLITLKPRVD